MSTRSVCLKRLESCRFGVWHLENIKASCLKRLESFRFGVWHLKNTKASPREAGKSTTRNIAGLHWNCANEGCLETHNLFFCVFNCKPPLALRPKEEEQEPQERSSQPV